MTSDMHPPPHPPTKSVLWFQVITTETTMSVYIVPDDSSMAEIRKEAGFPKPKTTFFELFCAGDDQSLHGFNEEGQEDVEKVISIMENDPRVTSAHGVEQHIPPNVSLPPGTVVTRVLTRMVVL